MKRIDYRREFYPVLCRTFLRRGKELVMWDKIIYSILKFDTWHPEAIVTSLCHGQSSKEIKYILFQCCHFFESTQSHKNKKWMNEWMNGRMGECLSAATRNATMWGQGQLLILSAYLNISISVSRIWEIYRGAWMSLKICSLYPFIPSRAGINSFFRGILQRCCKI